MCASESEIASIMQRMGQALKTHLLVLVQMDACLEKIGGKMRWFFPSLLGSLVIVLAIASSGGLNVGNAKLPFRIGWTRRRRFHQKLPIPNEALLEIREPIINITFLKKSNQFFERAKLTNFKLKIDYTILKMWCYELGP